MTLYHVLSDEENWSRSDVRASHRWTLPGIKCPFCKDTWGTTALAYPSIQTPDLKLTEKKGGRPVPHDEFQRILESLRPRLRPKLLVKPGTEFGPLEGKVIGKVGDFAWVHSWFLLVRKDSLARLKKLGFKSPRVVQPELSFGNKEAVSLLEFEIEALASWNTSKLKNAFECSRCTFFSSGLPDDAYPAIRRSSVPKHVDLFRVKQAPAIILATESFVEKVRGLNMQNIMFEAMVVV